VALFPLFGHWRFVSSICLHFDIPIDSCSRFLLFFFVDAAYVGLATIAGFVWWFVYSENGPGLPYSELVSHEFGTISQFLCWHLSLFTGTVMQ